MTRGWESNCTDRERAIERTALFVREASTWTKLEPGVPAFGSVFELTVRHKAVVWRRGRPWDNRWGCEMFGESIPVLRSPHRWKTPPLLAPFWPENTRIKQRPLVCKEDKFLLGYVRRAEVDSKHRRLFELSLVWRHRFCSPLYRRQSGDSKRSRKWFSLDFPDLPDERRPCRSRSCASRPARPTTVNASIVTATLKNALRHRGVMAGRRIQRHTPFCDGIQPRSHARLDCLHRQILVALPSFWSWSVFHMLNSHGKYLVQIDESHDSSSLTDCGYVISTLILSIGFSTVIQIPVSASQKIDTASEKRKQIVWRQASSSRKSWSKTTSLQLFFDNFGVYCTILTLFCKVEVNNDSVRHCKVAISCVVARL